MPAIVVNPAPRSKAEYPGRQGRFAARWHPRLLTALFTLLCLELARLALGKTEPWPAFPALARIWLATAASLGMALARRLPMENVIAAAAVAGGSGTALEILTQASGLPFGAGHLSAAPAQNPAAFLVATGSEWFSLTLLCRGAARLLLNGVRRRPAYGFGALAVGALLGTLLAELADAAARGAGDGIGPSAAAAAGREIAWGAVPGWCASLLLVLAFSTPWLVNKRPVVQPVDRDGLWVWAGLAGWLAVVLGLAGASGGSAAAAGLGAAVVAGDWWFGGRRDAATESR